MDVGTNPIFQIYMELYNLPKFIQEVIKISYIHSLLQGPTMCQEMILGIVAITMNDGQKHLLELTF